MEKLANRLASLIAARSNCEKSGNREWFERHTENAIRLTREFLPSGSGFDSGTQIDLNRSTAECLVFTTEFHHMDEGGGYDGWTEHTVTVRPSLLSGFRVTVGGRDRDGIKEYIAQQFNEALSIEVDRDGKAVIAPAVAVPLVALDALREIVKNDPYKQSSAGRIARIALSNLGFTV